MSPNEKHPCCRLRCPVPCVSVPFSRCVGCAFDERSTGGIREVHVYHSNLGIHRIATIDDEGLSNSHGVNCADCDYSMTILAEGETIASVSGLSGVMIYSLTLTTSSGCCYGPYCCSSGHCLVSVGLCLVSLAIATNFSEPSDLTLTSLPGYE